MVIKIDHPELDQNKTRLSSDVSASASSSTVENNAGFATNDLILFGQYGEEKSEIVPITSISGNTTIGHSVGPVFAHLADTLISKIPYNQVEIYRATLESGTYTLITTVDITPGEHFTVYDDTTGESTHWYKTRFKNSVTTLYSDYSDAIAGTGYSEDTLRSIVDEVLEDFGDENAVGISRNTVRRYARAGVRKLTVKLIQARPDYRKNYDTDDLTPGTQLYALPDRFLAFYRMDINLTGTSSNGAYKATFESEQKGYPDTTYYTNDPRVFFRGEYYGIRPTPTTTGKSFFWYWDYPDEMTDDNDTHGLPYGARDAIVSYCLWRLWLPRDEEKANVYKNDFKEAVADWLDMVGLPRQIATSGGVEVTFGGDLYEFDDE